MQRSTLRGNASPCPQLCGALLALALCVGTLQAAPCGDCDADGMNSAVDTLLVAQHTAGLIPVTAMAPDAMERCDLDSSGFFSLVDALMVAQMAVGLLPGMTCGMTTCDPTTRSWTQDPGTWMPPLGDMRLAYDSGREVVVAVLFPSTAGGAEVWEHDGTSWTQATFLTQPSSRQRPAFEYDSARGVCVLFGGISGVVLNDTWEWDGTSWTEKLPLTEPPARTNHSAAYDSARGVFVTWGGFDHLGTAVDPSTVWEYDGVDWVGKTTTFFPPGALVTDLPVIEFDSNRNVTVLQACIGTWEWDGASWRHAGPQPLDGRWLGYGAFDSCAGVMFYGGGAFHDDLWAWDGTTWTEIIPSGAGIVSLASGDCVYDSANGELVRLNSDGVLPPTMELWRF